MITINGRNVEYIVIGNLVLLNSILGFKENEYDNIIKRSDVVNGYRFINIDDTIACKASSGRKKDFEDIELLKKYQKNANNFK